jgi:hypothetical protein
MRAVLANLLICFGLLFVSAGTASGHVVVPNRIPVAGEAGFIGPLPKLRLPGAKWGEFQGIPGYSDFVPSDPAALGLSPGDKIPWVNGTPDFGQFGESVRVNGLTGDPLLDRNLAISELSSEKGISETAVRKWLTQNELRLHHFSDDIMQVVPAKLHRIPHQGSASELRNGY